VAPDPIFSIFEKTLKTHKCSENGNHDPKIIFLPTIAHPDGREAAVPKSDRSDHSNRNDGSLTKTKSNKIHNFKIIIWDYSELKNRIETCNSAFEASYRGEHRKNIAESQPACTAPKNAKTVFWIFQKVQKTDPC